MDQLGQQQAEQQQALLERINQSLIDWKRNSKLLTTILSPKCPFIRNQTGQASLPDLGSEGSAREDSR
jgi:hypothetical protein